MVMDLRPYDRRALELTGAAIDALAGADLDLTTPCEGWTVADLLRHLVSQNLRFAAGVAGTDPDTACPLDQADLGVDPAAAFRDSAVVVIGAFAVSDLADRVVRLPELSTAVPGPVALGFHFTDFMAHAWDVAVSVGLPLDVPAELSEQALRLAARIPDTPPVRGPGGAFAAKVTIDESAPPYDRLLAALGRDPRWTP